MKKLFAAVLVALMVSLGLTASTTSPASAIDCNTYNGCVVGKLRVNKITKLQYGKKNTFRVRITLPTAGSAIKATGTINLMFMRKGGGYTHRFAVRTYNGAPLYYRTPKLKADGRYKIVATFTASAPFSDLRNAKKNFVVKPRR